MTNDNVVSVFDAFGQAYEALKRVPELEAKINEHTSNLSTANQLIAQYDTELAALKADLSKALDAKTAVEASLETHRKSHGDLQARFDLVVGTLRDITSGIGSTLGVVEPPKEPEPSTTVGQSAADPTVTVPTTYATDPIDIVAGSAAGTTPTESQSATSPTVPVASPSPTVESGTSAPHSGPSDEPFSPSEARRKEMGLDWFDMDQVKHEAEVPVTPAVPFAPSTESQSTSAASPVEASSTTPPAPPSPNASLPNWILRSAGHGTD